MGRDPPNPHIPHHPEPRPLWGSPRSPLSCRALQLGPAPRPRALKTGSGETGPHTGQDAGVGAEGGGGGELGPSWRKLYAELLSGMFGFEHTYKCTEDTHTHTHKTQIAQKV